MRYEPAGAALGGLRGRQRDLPETVNVFWQNQSFHNYADYASGRALCSYAAPRTQR